MIAAQARAVACAKIFNHATAEARRAEALHEQLQAKFERTTSPADLAYLEHAHRLAGAAGWMAQQAYESWREAVAEAVRWAA